MSEKQDPTDFAEKPEQEDPPVSAGQSPSKRKSNRQSADPASGQPQDQLEQPAPQTEEQELVDDELLTDIRRSLLEEENSKKEKKEKGIIQRVTRRLIRPAAVVDADAEAPKAGEIEEAPVFEDPQKFFDEVAALSSWEEPASGFETTQPSGSDADEPVEWESPAFHPDPEAAPSIPEQSPPEMEEIQPRGSEVLRTAPTVEERDQNFEAIRDVALENYEEAPFLADSEQPVVSWRQSFKAFVRGLKPFERTLILGVAGLIIVTGMVSLGFMVIKAQVANQAVIPTQDLPYPVRVTLPGGWTFNLAKGTVVDDQWAPTWAEWLQGTEICKWVALPWSLQLEAVVRSFKADDVIELTMSNTDSLKFKVLSIESVPVDQIATLNRKTASLLLILVNKDSDTRWVVTAIP
jgi:hypothetical protein